MKQNVSKELRGRGIFGSSLPSAAAWIGKLPNNEEGTEFTTEIPFAKNGHPSWAIWYLPENGGDSGVYARTVKGADFACLKIDPKKNRYRCKTKRK